MQHLRYAVLFCCLFWINSSQVKAQSQPYFLPLISEGTEQLVNSAESFTLNWPVSNPRIPLNQGFSPNHPAIDITSQNSESDHPIFAAQSGVVMYAQYHQDPLGSGGWMIGMIMAFKILIDTSHGMHT